MYTKLENMIPMNMQWQRRKNFKTAEKQFLTTENNS